MANPNTFHTTIYTTLCGAVSLAGSPYSQPKGTGCRVHVFVLHLGHSGDWNRTKEEGWDLFPGIVYSHEKQSKISKIMYERDMDMMALKLKGRSEKKIPYSKEYNQECLMGCV